MIFKKSVLFFAIPALLVMTGCHDPAEKAAAPSLPPVEVQLETLTLSEVPVQIELAGSVQAVEHATISARVAGQVVTLPVQLGSKVKKGDLLVKISAAEINARVHQAEIQLSQAQRNLARESKLLEVNASTRERVKTLKEQVQTSEAAYREAQTFLGYTEIKAPFSGTVTDKLIEVGDLAASGAALLKLENGTTLEVVIQVPEAQSHYISLESRLPLTVPAAGLALNAQVREISPTVDPASRTTQIKLMLPAAPELRSGQFARVALVNSRATTLMINRRALRQNGQMHQVFVAEQGTARMRLVRTGAETDGRIEILSGLQAGDQVVIDAVDTLHDGQALKVKTDGSAQ
ncbi:MAG: efflux RND transporter periplasmic adaptor subunit [Desulfuromonadales bacterium]|nr:efflux RND transporter periplasmic adaptor subunit [Desulfuromonadales bacterium]